MKLGEILKDAGNFAHGFRKPLLTFQSAGF